MSYRYAIYVVDDGDTELVNLSVKYPEQYTAGEETFIVVGDELYDVQIINPRIVAILSSPLAFAGGLYKSNNVAFPTSLEGIPSYCGHPATRELLAALGAEYTPGRWEGPRVGESFLAVPLVRNEREGGFTVDTAIESIASLDAVLVTRIA